MLSQCPSLFPLSFSLSLDSFVCMHHTPLHTYMHHHTPHHHTPHFPHHRTPFPLPTPTPTPQAMSYVSWQSLRNALLPPAAPPAPAGGSTRADRVAAFARYITSIERRGGGLEVPPFPQGAQWYNAPPLSWERELRGKVVVLDFWTYCCIKYVFECFVCVMHVFECVVCIRMYVLCVVFTPTHPHPHPHPLPRTFSCNHPPTFTHTHTPSLSHTQLHARVA